MQAAACTSPIGTGAQLRNIGFRGRLAAATFYLLSGLTMKGGIRLGFSISERSITLLRFFYELQSIII